MSLIIKDENDLQCMPIISATHGDRWKIRSLGFIPPQVREWSPQVKMNVSENPDHYVLSSELLGVELKNLWIYIEGRTLTLYAGITGERQGAGEYCYDKDPFGWIKGEIILPERIRQRPKTASFNGHFLFLRFIEKADASS